MSIYTYDAAFLRKFHLAMNFHVLVPIAVIEFWNYIWAKSALIGEALSFLDVGHYFGQLHLNFYFYLELVNTRKYISTIRQSLYNLENIISHRNIHSILKRKEVL